MGASSSYPFCLRCVYVVSETVGLGPKTSTPKLVLKKHRHPQIEAIFTSLNRSSLSKQTWQLAHPHVARPLLQVCSQHLNLGSHSEDILSWAARSTGGFLPCDLVALCRSAALIAVAQTADEKGSLQVLKEHFQKLEKDLDKNELFADLHPIFQKVHYSLTSNTPAT